MNQKLSTILLALSTSVALFSCSEKAVAPEVCLDVKNKRGSAEFFVNDTVFIINCGERAAYNAIFTGQEPNIYGSKGVVTVMGLDSVISNKDVVTARGLNFGAEQRLRVIYTTPGTKEIVMILSDVQKDGTDIARSEKRTTINVNP